MCVCVCVCVRNCAVCVCVPTSGGTWVKNRGECLCAVAVSHMVTMCALRTCTNTFAMAMAQTVTVCALVMCTSMCVSLHTVSMSRMVTVCVCTQTHMQ